MKRTIGVALICAALLPLSASAQTGSLLLSPVKTAVSAKPGESVEVPISLQNTTNKPLTAQVSAKDFTAGPEQNGEPALLNTPNQTYGLANWLNDANIQKTLTIPAKQTITYPARFTVPASAQERTYFGSVIFSYTADGGQPVSLGSLVFITVGNPSINLSIDKMSREESENAADTHGVIAATITNKGEGLADPSFRLRITGNNGRLLEEITADAAGSVLPQSSRIYSFALTRPLPDEHITFTLNATDQHGKTTDKALQLDLRKQETAPASQAEDSNGSNSLILPLLAALLALVLAAGGLVLRRRLSAKKETVKLKIDPGTPDTDAAIHSSDKNTSNL